jgi:hypothetical protein
MQTVQWTALWPQRNKETQGDATFDGHKNKNIQLGTRPEANWSMAQNQNRRNARIRTTSNYTE